MTSTGHADDGTTRRGRPVKVARLIDEYELTGLGDELVHRWTAPPDERESLRALADLINRRLLKVVLEAEGVRPPESEVETYVDVLTGTDASSGERTDVERELEWNGVDVEILESDFVSHQAVHSYLTDYREVSPSDEPQSAEERLAKGKGTIDRLEGRLAAVTESVLEQLRDSGWLALGEFRVFTHIEVYCDDCDTQHGVGELLTSGGCDCDVEDD